MFIFRMMILNLCIHRDLTGISDLRSIPGILVKLENKGLFFYHESEEDLPPPGEGVRAFSYPDVDSGSHTMQLNTAALVTLEGVYPVDKATGKAAPTSDPNKISKFAVKLKKKTAKMPGGKFVEYDAPIGAWTFSVQHF